MPISREETIRELLRRSKRRRSVPLRRVFLQQGTRSQPDPGPLAKLVANRDVTALDLYLLQRALATAKPYDSRLEATVWARLLGLQSPAAATVVSRAWSRLAAMRLIKRRRGGRLAITTSLLEDGSGKHYRPPGLAPGDNYLQLPLAYWLDGFDRRLTLRAKAMLLIGLSLQDWSELPSEKVPKWYGISADTAERGLSELVDVGLLQRRVKYKRTPLVASGFTRTYQYMVAPSFRRARKLVVVVSGGLEAAGKAG